MRFSLVPLVPLVAILWASPVAAQSETCEASLTGPMGEVMALVERGRTRATSIAWFVRRQEGVGEESDHFSRPDLTLDFFYPHEAASLALAALEIGVSRYSDREVGRAPKLSDVRVRASPAGGLASEWVASDPNKGQAALAKQLKQSWPPTLTFDLKVGNAVVASATFDLSVLPAVERLAREAEAEAFRKCAPR
jgi:hypothetical protein